MRQFSSVSEQFDPSGLFAGAAGAALVGLLIWAGLTFLVLLGVYWLIRLAVRHGTMDTARWQAAGRPSRADARQRQRHRNRQQRREPTRSRAAINDAPRGPRDW